MYSAWIAMENSAIWYGHRLAAMCEQVAQDVVVAHGGERHAGQYDGQKKRGERARGERQEADGDVAVVERGAERAEAGHGAPQPVARS